MVTVINNYIKNKKNRYYFFFFFVYTVPKVTVAFSGRRNIIIVTAKNINYFYAVDDGGFKTPNIYHAYT